MIADRFRTAMIATQPCPHESRHGLGCAIGVRIGRPIDVVKTVENPWIDHDGAGPTSSLSTSRIPTTKRYIRSGSKDVSQQPVAVTSEKIREKIPGVKAVNTGHDRSPRIRPLPNAGPARGTTGHRRRTAVRPLDPPTDQKVGGSSPSERADPTCGFAIDLEVFAGATPLTTAP